MKYDFLIVGAGLSGSVLAERIATQLNKTVLLVEKRNHIAGNCYDEYDENGILVHRYGPHIFHTNDKNVVDYLSQFTEWYPYEHRVLAYSNNQFYPIPINKTTVNKVFNKNFNSENEVKEFLESIRIIKNKIENSEDIIVNQVGFELFEKFFLHYTKKQWNLEPKELSPAVCGRLKLRYNDDDRYFEDKYQLMPLRGFTRLFEKMLDNKNIKILLNTDYKKILNDVKYNYLIYTGPIDYFFDYKFGKLSYRSIEFEFKNFKMESYQPVSVVNYVDSDVPYTRVTEYKKLTNQNSNTTTVSYEYPVSNGESYYPILTQSNVDKLNLYLNEVRKNPKLILCGRLAEFKYYDMHQVVARALSIFEKTIKHLHL